MGTLFNIVFFKMSEIKSSGMFPINDTLIPDVYILDNGFLKVKNKTLPTVNLCIESCEKVT